MRMKQYYFIFIIGNHKWYDGEIMKHNGYKMVEILEDCTSLKQRVDIYYLIMNYSSGLLRYNLWSLRWLLGKYNHEITHVVIYCWRDVCFKVMPCNYYCSLHSKLLTNKFEFIFFLSLLRNNQGIVKQGFRELWVGIK